MKLLKWLLNRFLKVEKRKVYDITLNQYQTAKYLLFLGYYVRVEYEAVGL